MFTSFGIIRRHSKVKYTCGILYFSPPTDFFFLFNSLIQFFTNLKFEPNSYAVSNSACLAGKRVYTFKLRKRDHVGIFAGIIREIWPKKLLACVGVCACKLLNTIICHPALKFLRRANRTTREYFFPTINYYDYLKQRHIYYSTIVSFFSFPSAKRSLKDPIQVKKCAAITTRNFSRYRKLG